MEGSKFSAVYELHLVALQEWTAYAQTKTARHKLTKFLKDHGHLLEEAVNAESYSSSAPGQKASLNGASSATFSDIQVSFCTYHT